MKICSVNGCQLKALSLDGTMCKFPSPEDPERRAKWVRFCNRGQKWEPYKFSSICSGHFLPDDFIGSAKQRILKVIAVPTQLMCNSSTISSNMQAERVSPMILGVASSKQIASRQNLTKLLGNKVEKPIQETQIKPICRICLTNSSTPFISLFAKFEGEYVAHIIQFCTSLEIQREDDLPQFICDYCFKNLKVASELKRTSIQSDIYLRTLKFPLPTETLNELNDVSSIFHSKIKTNSSSPILKPASYTTNHFMIQEQPVPQQFLKHFIIGESKVTSSIPKPFQVDEFKIKTVISKEHKEATSQFSKHFIIGETKVTSNLPAAKKAKNFPFKNKDSIPLDLIHPPKQFSKDKSQVKPSVKRKTIKLPSSESSLSSHNKTSPIPSTASSSQKRELTYEEYEKERKRAKKSNKIQKKLKKTLDAKALKSRKLQIRDKQQNEDSLVNALIPEIIYEQTDKDVVIKLETEEFDCNKVIKLEPKQQSHIIVKSPPKVKEEPNSDDDTIEFRASDYDFLI